MEENNNETKKGFSWLGFFFSAYYYAGYGKLVKGIVLSVLQICIPIIGTFGVMIYGGIKERKELPIKEVAFKWLNVVIIFIVGSIISFVFMTFLSSFQNSMSWDDREKNKLKNELSYYKFNDAQKECVYDTILDNLPQNEFTSLRSYQVETVIGNAYEQYCQNVKEEKSSSWGFKNPFSSLKVCTQDQIYDFSLDDVLSKSFVEVTKNKIGDGWTEYSLTIPNKRPLIFKVGDIKHPSGESCTQIVPKGFMPDYMLADTLQEIVNK